MSIYETNPIQKEREQLEIQIDTIEVEIEKTQREIDLLESEIALAKAFMANKFEIKTFEMKIVELILHDKKAPDIVIKASKNVLNKFSEIMSAAKTKTPA